jgi:putative oxidoreductase
MLLSSDPVAEDAGKLLLRVVAGGGMVWQHGWPKIMRFGELMDGFGDPIGLGSPVSLILIVVAEAVCATLVALGLWTRITTLPVIIGMAVAAFISNGNDPFGAGEKALVYMGAYLAIFFLGSGRFSLDRISFR